MYNLLDGGFTSVQVQGNAKIDNFVHNSAKSLEAKYGNFLIGSAAALVPTSTVESYARTELGLHF